MRRSRRQLKKQLKSSSGLNKREKYRIATTNPYLEPRDKQAEHAQYVQGITGTEQQPGSQPGPIFAGDVASRGVDHYRQMASAAEMGPDATALGVIEGATDHILHLRDDAQYVGEMGEGLSDAA